MSSPSLSVHESNDCEDDFRGIQLSILVVHILNISYIA